MYLAKNDHRWVTFIVLKTITRSRELSRGCQVDPDPDVCSSAAEALGKLGKHAAPAVPALTKCLEVPQDFIRRSAIHALGNLGEHAASAVEALITYLKHRRSYVRCEEESNSELDRMFV